MSWLVLVVLNATGTVPPEWATVHRPFDASGFVLAPGAVSGGAATSWQFGEYFRVALGRARLDIGLPAGLELGIFAEGLVVPLNPLGWGGSARMSVRWAPLAWGRWPVNPTVGLVVYSTGLGKILVGPRAGIAGTLLDPRWHWALDSSLVLRGQTPSAYDYLVSSCWLAELNAQTSFQLAEPLSAGLYVALRRAGPSPDGGHSWTSTLYPTTDASLEAGAFVLLSAGFFNVQLSFGFRRHESPEDPGVTIFLNSASLTVAVTAAGSPWPESEPLKPAGASR